MHHLNDALAQGFMNEYPETDIRVIGGGTEAGLISIAKGEADICAASRQLLPDEIKLIAEESRTIGVSYPIAKDAVYFIVNQANPIDNLTTIQIRSILKCKIYNWSELGGPDMEINLSARKGKSGTYDYVKKYLLNEYDYCTDMLIYDNMEDHFEQVQNDTAAFSFTGIKELENVKLLNVDGFSPNYENIKGNKYPVNRLLYYYTTDIPDQSTKEFLNWIITGNGRKILIKEGFIPLW